MFWCCPLRGPRVSSSGSQKIREGLISQLEEGEGCPPHQAPLFCTRSPCLAFGGLCRPRSLLAPPPALSAWGKRRTELAGPLAAAARACLGPRAFQAWSRRTKAREGGRTKGFSRQSEKPQINTGALRWRGGAGGQTSDPFLAQPASQVWGLRKPSLLQVSL